MRYILNRVAESAGEFRPKTTREFFALRVATKLCDLKRLRWYVSAGELHSEQSLLELYRSLRSDECRNAMEQFDTTTLSLNDEENA